MRVPLAIVAALLGIAGATWLNTLELRVEDSMADGTTDGGARIVVLAHKEHPGWADPAAVALAVLGVGTATVLVRQAGGPSSQHAPDHPPPG